MAVPYTFATATSPLPLSQLDANFSYVNSPSNIPYTASVTNAVARSVSSKLGDILSLRDFGAACDGTTNDDTAVQNAINGIGATSVTLIIPGPTKISSNKTFAPNTQLVFEKGGYFLGTAGTELIITQSQVVADRTLVFSNCLSRATISQNVYPEWFGAKNDGTTDCAAAFNSAVYYLQYVGGLIDMLGGTYLVGSTITINKNKITLQGAGNNVTYIKTSANTVYPLVVSGSSGTPTSNVMLRDFSILSYTPSSTAVGLQLYYAAFPIVERMQIQDFIVGLSMQNATNSQITKIGATYTGSSNNFIGFDINGVAPGNASSILRDCYAQGNASATVTGHVGFKMRGVYMSDCQFDNCETAVTSYGYFFDYSTAPDYNVDVVVRNPIVDRYWSQGIFINALPSNGNISILGGYTNPDTVGSETDNIYLNSCVGHVLIEGHDFEALTNYAYTYGIKAISSSGAIINGNSFNGCYVGIYGNTFTYSQIVGNLFKNMVHAASIFIQINGGVKVMVNSNAFDGYATYAVYFDGTSSGCGIVGNCANITNITTRFSNNGSSPVGGSTGSTGLNSGV